ncbi:MAG TPA: DUF1549 domain-containing protein, partial [Chthoniobacteraceae bacterium]
MEARRSTLHLLLVTGLAGGAFLPAALADSGEKIDFNYDIRPILSSKCFHCHGRDEAARKGHLRLDSLDEAMKEHDDEKAIVPGHPDDSALVTRIHSSDPDEIMPPPKEKKKLTENEVALLTKWIVEGAEYKPHWAFVVPVRSEPPKIADCGLVGADWPAGVHPEDWTRNPIDGFVLKKMVAGGLKPSPQADPWSLCRRLYLDLIGLPPTPAELGEFTREYNTTPAEGREGAVEHLVDRLLASPHYGEKWSRMWLDLARYADSTGYGSDFFRLNIWPWRDWVINAFNRNLPYDEFTIDQLAGDLLPNPTPEQVTATAFNRNTMTNVEGGVVAEEYRVAAVKDRIATTSQVWMGLTMQCAQCHSHKFDPITQKEYYQFFAIFNQTEDNNRSDEEPKFPLPTPEEAKKMERLKKEIADLEKKLEETSPELQAEQKKWEVKIREPVEWTPLAPAKISAAPAEVKFETKPDGSILAEGGGATETYTLEVPTELKGITAFRLETLPDDSLPAKGLGHADGGNAVVSSFSITAGPREAKPPLARFVRVEAPGKNRILSLAEVQVFDGDVNVALKGKASQSSTDFNGPPELAIDGNTDGDYEKSHSVSHTKDSTNPWWEVDLGAETPVDRVVVWNRTDGGLGARLAKSRVVLLDAARKELAELKLAEAPNPTTEFSPRAGLANVALQHASADFSQAEFSVANAIDPSAGKKVGWAFAPETAQTHAAVFEAKKIVGDGDTLLTFRIEQNYGERHTLGRFRLFATTSPLPVRELTPTIKETLALDDAQRTPAQRDQLAAYFRPLAQSTESINREIEARRKELAAIKPIQIPVMREVAAGKRRESHLLNKGNYLAPGEKVEPGLPAAFSSWFKCDGAPDRLSVARWLLSPENPLTARVAANRYWAQLFGTGIVETEEDFGTQGSLPTHPQLLDWLAVAFESPKNSDPAQLGLGWDMKALIRLIVTSATYQQSSRFTPEDLEKDA